MNLLKFREDPAIARTFETLGQDPRLQIDKSVLQELQNMTVWGKAKKDISAARYKTREDLHTLAEQYETVQHYRGRALRIKTGHLPIQRVLKRLWQTCVSALYHQDGIAKLSPVARKEAALAMILQPLRERLDDCELVIETATEVEKLLSNAYYTLRELRSINEAFLYESKRESGV